MRVSSGHADGGAGYILGRLRSWLCCHPGKRSSAQLRARSVPVTSAGRRVEIMLELSSSVCAQGTRVERHGTVGPGPSVSGWA